MQEKYRSESIDRLFNILIKLKSVEECYNLFEDLCTIKEIQDMAQRLDTAILLSENESYQVISEKIGVSSATISRVNHCLNYGSGGYKKAVEEIKNNK